MKIDLATGSIPNDIMEAREFLSICEVLNVPSTAIELQDAIKGLKYYVEGMEDWDYKDSRSYSVGLWNEILNVIPGVTITSISDGGKYGHVYFSFNGGEGKLGYIE